MSEDNKQTLKDVMAELETDLNNKLELQNERIQHLEQDYEHVLGDYHRHTLTPQHQMPELDMMFRRLKHIKCVLQLSCSNI